MSAAIHRKTQPIDLPSRQAHRPTLHIQELVALSYDLHPNHMTSSERSRHISQPRQIAMYLTRQLTSRSFPAIAGAFGHKHHTTVMHAIRAVERRMAADPLVKADVQALREALLS